QNNSNDRQRYQNVKKSIRLAYAEAKDELVRFVSFTTALVIVFIMFPRLKLLSMAVASVTLLIFDLVFPARLMVNAKRQDLISNLLAKTLKI
ncbi:MAG: hypothetical protein ABIH84_01925, partial [bacterium]